MCWIFEDAIYESLDFFRALWTHQEAFFVRIWSFKLKSEKDKVEFYMRH